MGQLSLLVFRWVGEEAAFNFFYLVRVILDILLISFHFRKN